MTLNQPTGELDPRLLIMEPPRNRHPGYTITKGTAARRRAQGKRHQVQAQKRHLKHVRR